MRLTHVNVSMPKGCEDIARAFYTGQLGLREIPKPEQMRVRGGVWFEAGGFDIHVSVEESHSGADVQRHFGIECANLDELRVKLNAAGVKTEEDKRAPWKRFFVRDPFGNRIEIHEVGAFRG